MAETNETPRSEWKDWIWPMPKLWQRAPVISDGFGRAKRGGKGHFGIDIMHHRKPGDETLEHKASDGTTSKGYVIFENEKALAAGPGKVYAIENTSTGTTVKISHRVHGRPILSVYRHLTTMHPIKKDDILLAGQPLGFVGDNPQDKDPPHLHFELWDTGLGNKYPDWNIDPARVMREWRLVDGDSENKTIGPYDGDKLPNPSPDAFTSEQDTKPNGDGGGIARFLLTLFGGGFLASRLLKSRKGGYI